jgi:hypothetical protein
MAEHMSLDELINELMDPDETVKYLESKNVKRTKQTLAKGRYRGTDTPPFRKLGRRVVYARSDVDSWLLESLSPAFHSTSAARDHEARGGSAP